jgi:Camelysin metallo-endopeptidase
MRISIQIVRNGQAPASQAAEARRPRSRGRKLALTMLVLGLVSAAASYGVYSSFTATTGNASNSFAAGSVAISDNDSSTAMLALTNAKPGDSDTSCIKITYTGSLDAGVRLYGSISGSLASYLTLTVTRGTDSSPSFDSCTNFTADGTNYLGLGNGVIYQGSLASYPANYAAGIVDPKTATPETWTTNEAHSYKFTITLDDNNAAQSLTGSASFTWEARNL